MDHSRPTRASFTPIARGPWALGALVAVALLVAGCGSSKKSTTAGSAESAAGTSSTSTSPASVPVTLRSKSSKLGRILAAGPRRMTVYVYEADKGSTPTCLGPCAAVWPPVTAGATAAVVARRGVSAEKLALTTRSDGTKQVTYNGHPLYFYARDGDKGDAYGQGIKSFGASWYVLAPSGKKIDHS
jgi:predicted lipoprotein with Yx(FWY)xxD motif